MIDEKVVTITFNGRVLEYAEKILEIENSEFSYLEPSTLKGFVFSALLRKYEEYVSLLERVELQEPLLNSISLLDPKGDKEVE